MSVTLQTLIAAQAGAPTPSALEVDIVGDDKSLLQELLPALGPLIGALAGGIGGVMLGARFQRKTLEKLEKERHEREDAREKERHEREDAREKERAERDDDADRRRAIGALRIARRYFAGILRHTLVAADKLDYAFVQGIEQPLRPEEEQLIAAWVTNQEWGLYTIATGQIRVLDLLLTRDQHGHPTPQGLRALRNLHEDTKRAVLTLQKAQSRLAAELGEAEDPYAPLWEMEELPYGDPQVDRN